MCWLNVASSTLFLSNAVVAHALQQRLYTTLLLALVLTSWGAHGTSNRTVKLVDKVVVYMVVSYGAYYMLKKGPRKNAFYWTVTLLATSIIVFLYFGGACFDPDYGACYHAYLHAASSISHHAILAMV
jgi:hypothetical protein